MKRWIITALLLLSAGVFIIRKKGERDLIKYAKHCPFCRQTVLQKQKIYEDELIYVLYDNRPILPGHALIIPKRHVQTFTELTPKEMLSLQDGIQKIHQATESYLGTSSYLLLQKNGREVGQSVPHVHFHYIPREEGNYSSITLLTRFLLSPILPKLSDIKMAEMVALVQSALRTCTKTSSSLDSKEVQSQM